MGTLSRRRVAAPASWLAQLGLSAAVLTSCDGLDGSAREQGDQWVHDEDSERWLLPGSLTASSEQVAEHRPPPQTVPELILIGGGPERVDDGELRSVIVGPLEEEISPGCDPLIISASDM